MSTKRTGVAQQAPSANRVRRPTAAEKITDRFAKMKEERNQLRQEVAKLREERLQLLKALYALMRDPIEFDENEVKEIVAGKRKGPSFKELIAELEAQEP